MHAPVDPKILRKRLPGFGEFVALVALTMGVTAYGVDNTLPAFPALARAFGVTDPNQLQLVIYVYMAGFGVAQLIYGPISDVVGRRPALFFGLAIYALGALMATLSDDLNALLFARAIQGAGAGAGRVLAVAIVRDLYNGREMARVMSLTTIVFIMVPVLAPAIGGLILWVADWHAIFGSMLALGIGIGIWFAIRMPETLHPDDRMPPSAGRILEGIRMTVTCRPALGYGTAFGCLFGCMMGYVGSSQQIFAGEVYGLGAYFPVVFGSVAILMGLAALINSRLVRRHGMHRISHLSILAFVVVGLLLCALALAYHGRPPLFAFVALLGLGQLAGGLAMPNFNALAMEPLGKVAGTASSLIGSYTTLIGAGFGALVGQSFDGTVFPLSLGYLGLGITAVVVVLITEHGRLFRPTHKEPPR